MTDQELKDLNAKLNELGYQKSSISSFLNLLLNAAMPIAIAVIGIYFTNQNNRRQIEFQQIQVANQMVADVQSDPDFTKEKLDLKLSFVESMFENEKFKTQVKNLLTQTFAVSLQSLDLEKLAQSGNPEDAMYVQNKIAEAKKFNDTSINNVVTQLEKKEPVRKLTKPENLKSDMQLQPYDKTDSMPHRKSSKYAKEDSLKSNQTKKPGRTNPNQ